MDFFWLLFLLVIVVVALVGLLFWIKLYPKLQKDTSGLISCGWRLPRNTLYDEKLGGTGEVVAGEVYRTYANLMVDFGGKKYFKRYEKAGLVPIDPITSILGLPSAGWKYLYEPENEMQRLQKQMAEAHRENERLQAELDNAKVELNERMKEVANLMQKVAEAKAGREARARE